MAKKKQQKKSKNKNNESKNVRKSHGRPKDEITRLILWVVAIAALAIIVFFIARDISSSSQSGLTPENVILKNIDTEEAFTYNGYPFIKKDGIWTTQIEVDGQVYEIAREYSPREVEGIEIVYSKNDFAALIQKYRRVYLALDPESEGGNYVATVGSSMVLSLKEVYGVKISAACTQNHTACEGRTIITCGTSETLPVIQINYGGQPRAEYNGKCLIISGSEEGLIKAVDKVIYGWYGIME